MKAEMYQESTCASNSHFYDHVKNNQNNKYEYILLQRLWCGDEIKIDISNVS